MFERPGNKYKKKEILAIPTMILPTGSFFFLGPSCGNLIKPNKYNARPSAQSTQIAINISLFNNPQCSTRSALERNLKAKANSIKPKTTFTVLSQPPLFGKVFNQFGNNANKANGNAKANPKPPIPIDNCIAPPSLDKEPPSRDPKIGPVHEKETMASVRAIKKIPMIPPILLALSSILLLQDCGNVIS